MFALLSARFRNLLILMIAVPIGGRFLEAVGRRIEKTSGPNRVSRALRSSGRTAGRFSRGPLRPRYAQDAAQGAAPGSTLNGRSASSAQGRKRNRRRAG